MSHFFKCKREKTDTILFSELDKPKSFFKRNNGLMFKKPLNKNQALMITGCNCIHTFFMNFSIDVIYLNKKHEIKKIKKNIKPYKLTMPVIGSWSVIECTTGNKLILILLIKPAILLVGQRIVI